MNTTTKLKQTYTEIQKKLFYMIPEKWDKVYLYASVIEGINKLQTGEMFFYYFPKGILKKTPVNVYEVPNKFNIDETEYFKLTDELYGVIKRLRKEFYETNGKIWSNITISIENFKFIVEYSYDDLSKMDMTSYERHIVWRYEYLKTGINTYNRKERSIIENYLQNRPYVKEKKETYIEGIYQNPVHNVIDYDRIDIPKKTTDDIVKQQINHAQKQQQNQILHFNKWES